MIPSNITVLLAVEPVDMRRSFDGLARAVEERLGLKPESERKMFVFVNRRRDMMKLLWRDASGWCLLAKRLDEREVPLPRDIAAGARSVQVDGRTLAAMLDGVLRRRNETARTVAHDARAAANIVRKSLRTTQPSS